MLCTMLRYVSADVVVSYDDDGKLKSRWYLVFPLIYSVTVKVYDFAISRTINLFQENLRYL